MNKKGFTLVELITIIGIIAIIMLLSFPAFTKELETRRKNKYNNFLNDLCLASESYINSDDMLSEQLSGNNNISFKLEKLVNNGYIKKNLKNPNTNQKINLSDTLTVTLDEDKTYNCTLGGGK